MYGNNDLIKNDNEDTTKYESIGYALFDDESEAFYARMKGKSHERLNTNCQDYCEAKQIKNTMVIAVSDGVGSDACPYSDVGSKLAIVSLYETLNNLLDISTSDEFITENVCGRVFKKNLLNVWKEKCLSDYKERNKQEEYSSNEGDNGIIRKYSATLLFVIITKSNYIYGQLGDGNIMFFGENGYYQDARLMWAKYNTKVYSLSSSIALLSLKIAPISRNNFNRILLSTDGIYDRLDKKDSFYKYALSITNRCKGRNYFQKPFYWDDTDITGYTSDDCSVILFVDKAQEEDIIGSDISLLNEYFSDLSFRRLSDDVRVYNGCLSNDLYEIHIYNNCESHVFDIRVLDDLNCKARKCIKFNFSNNRSAFAYPVLPKDYKTFEYLSDVGAFYEYPILYNNAKYEPDDDSVEDVYGGRYGIELYKKYISLFERIKMVGYVPTAAFYETLKADISGRIAFCEAALKPAGCITEDELQRGIKADQLIREQFNILGVLQCGNREIPLHKISRINKNYVHRGHEDVKMLKLVFSKSRNSYAILNLSGLTWEALYLDGRTQSCSYGEILELEDGLEFSVVKKDSSFIDTTNDNTNKYYFIDLENV